MSADEAIKKVVERVARAIWESYWPDRDASWVHEQWEANAVFDGDRVQRVPRILAEIAVPFAFDAGRKSEREWSLEAYEALQHAFSLLAENERLRGVIQDIRSEACALSDDDDATGGIRAEILAAANAILEPTQP